MSREEIIVVLEELLERVTLTVKEVEAKHGRLQG
jgi:hypothetical protein